MYWALGLLATACLLLPCLVPNPPCLSIERATIFFFFPSIHPTLSHHQSPSTHLSIYPSIPLPSSAIHHRRKDTTTISNLCCPHRLF
ncbi:hypothetical protein F5X96DRAFT_647833 [Biscogniauxia mediterranea]|nr:hypothetical protein F5X96DRAFT_647833 [Biscogniauxia mediterranea]